MFLSVTIASTEDRLGLLKTDLRNCTSVGAANRCSSFWAVLRNLGGVLKVSPRIDRGLSETPEEHQAAAAACEGAATSNRSGLLVKKGTLSYCSAESCLKQTRAFSVGIEQLSRSTAWLRTWLPIAAGSARQRQGPCCEQQTRALPWWGCATEHRRQCCVSGPGDSSSLSLSAAPQGWGWGLWGTSHQGWGHGLLCN